MNCTMNFPLTLGRLMLRCSQQAEDYMAPIKAQAIRVKGRCYEFVNQIYNLLVVAPERGRVLIPKLLRM